LVDSDFTRLTIYGTQIFFNVRTLKIFAKYRRSVDFNYCCPFLTARYKKIWTITEYIFGMSQRVRRSM